MGTGFEELDDFLDDSLTLPINGRDYVIPAVPGKDGLWAQRVLEEVERAKKDGDADAGRLDDGDERLLYQRMLGPVFDEMLDDGVTWQRISHAAMTVFFWTTSSRETAEKYWKSGGDPERLRSAGSTPRQGSRRASAAAGSTTRSPGSTSGTKAAKTSARKSKVSAGKKSSKSGG